MSQNAGSAARRLVGDGRDCRLERTQGDCGAPKIFDTLTVDPGRDRYADPPWGDWEVRNGGTDWVQAKIRS